MAGQSSKTDAIISTVFGTLGAVCWSIQLTPQIILNYRRHSASGLSRGFMLLWACAGIPLGVYNILAGFDIALQVQPQILTVLSLVTWAQCCCYEQKWSVRKVIIIASMLTAFMGGVEVALYFAVRAGLQTGTHWPLQFMGALAALFLALGVIEQYIQIWKHQSVEGISFLFCGIDALGDVTSIISVSFESTLDILGVVMYAVELVLWIGVFACGAYFKFVPWVKKIVGKRRRTEVSESGAESTGHGISLRDLPSSTSVFRTASRELEAEPRRRAPQHCNAEP